VSFLLVAVISTVAFALLPNDFKFVGVLSSFPFAVVGTIAAWRQRSQLSSVEAETLQNAMAGMNWREFSTLLKQAFVKEGYTVTAVPPSDGLGDFLLTRQGQTTLVCAKRWKAAAWGIDNMQTLLSEKETHGASHLMCVSLLATPNTLKKFVTQQPVTWLSGQALWALVASIYPNTARPQRTSDK
jgi:restriction system protein